MKRKIKEWLKRYLPAEIIGTITAVGGASITHLFSKNLILVAYMGSLSEAIGFYSTILTQHILRVIEKREQFQNYQPIINDLAREIGLFPYLDPAELNLADKIAYEFHKPENMKLPAFYPDAPEIRKDMSQYYDDMTAADYIVGDVMAWLEKYKLTENTIILVAGDHGRGMPRSKRWVYDSGIKVPLLIRWPAKIKPATVRNDLVCFIDFAPTMLSIAGVEIPSRMQGQIFLGDKRAKDRKYVYAARDRMDEVYDRIRAVRDLRYKYIRNFEPELPYAQKNAYNEENPTMQVWRRLSEQGKLTGAPAIFFAPTKPKEEFYDTQTDPDEVKNLASDPKYKNHLERLRGAMNKWIVDTKDLGEVPETELIKRGIVRDVLTEYGKRKKQ